MNISQRLKSIVDMTDRCNCLADIGTDHGYIPIYAIEKNICNTSIASDINKGPIKIALKNIKKYGMLEKIQTRIGPGLSTLSLGEADVIIIAGMGGNLIADIINDDINIAMKADYLIVQPVQYPEVIRKYLSKMNFKILDEDLVKDENKYYHIIKAKYGDGDKYSNEAEHFMGLRLIEKKHPLLKSYIEYKLNRIDEILSQMSSNTVSTKYKELKNQELHFKEVLKCL